MRPLLRPPSLNDDDLDPWYRTIVQLSSSGCELSARLRRKSRRISAPPKTAAASAGLYGGRYDDAEGDEEVETLYDGRYDDCDDAINRLSIEAAILGLRRIAGYGGGRGEGKREISGLGCSSGSDRELVDEDELYGKVDTATPRAGEGANRSGGIGGDGELPRFVEAFSVMSGECSTVATKSCIPDDDRSNKNQSGNSRGKDKQEIATNDTSTTGALRAAPPTPRLSSSSITILPTPNTLLLRCVSDATTMVAASNTNHFLRNDGGGSDLRRWPVVEGAHVDAAAAILSLGGLSGAAVVDCHLEPVVESQCIDADPRTLSSCPHPGTRQSLPSSLSPPPEQTNQARLHDGVHRGREQCLRLPPVPALPPLALPPPHQRTSHLTPLSSQPQPMIKASSNNGILVTSPNGATPEMNYRQVSWESAREAGKRYPAFSSPTGTKSNGNANINISLPPPSMESGATDERGEQNGEEKESKTLNPVPSPVPPEGGKGVSQRKRKRKLVMPDGESKDSFSPPAGPRCRHDALPGVNTLEGTRDVHEDTAPTEKDEMGSAEEPRSKHKHDRKNAPYHRPFTKTDEIKRRGSKKGKYIPRKLVVHVPYRDWSNEPPPTPSRGTGTGTGTGTGVARLASSANIIAGPKSITFPTRLFCVLEELEKDGIAESVASWRPHGRCFAVQNTREFERLWPVYVRKAGCSDGKTSGMKYQSFQRQLNLYGFQRITVGWDKGCSYHPMFLRGRGYLAQQVPRIRIKGNGCRAADNPDEEPDFYAMPAVKPLGTVPPRLPALPKQWPKSEDGVHRAHADKAQALQHYVHSKCSPCG